MMLYLIAQIRDYKFNVLVNTILSGEVSEYIYIYIYIERERERERKSERDLWSDRENR